MLVLETVLRIRREHAAGKAIKAIMRDLHLSRKVVRKAIRSPEADMGYRREVQPLPKLGPFQARLNALLDEDEARPRREKLRITRIHDLLLREGFDGSYDAVRRYAARWRQARRRDVMNAPAFIPLLFRPGEAYQFDWSHEDVEIAGKPMRVKVAHVRLCASRVIYVRAYPRETQEMLFDAHARAFAFFGGVPTRGIYDNMKTAVDQVKKGKGRVVNARFAVMCAHYLFDADFCNVASGWEKGVVEKNVQDSRRRIWIDAAKQRFGSFAELNAWLGERCRSLWAEVRHPEHSQFSVAEMLEHERAHLMSMPQPFDGYVERPARVTSTCLVSVARNRYSVPCELAGQMVSTRLYPTRVAVVANDEVVAQHERLTDRGQTRYDWQHYIPLVQRKPGALRNGAPFADLPPALQQLRKGLLRQAGGDRVMAQVLAIVSTAGLDAVLVAVELALESAPPSGKVSVEHVINVLSRLNPAPTPEDAQTCLQTAVAPLANTARYDSLRGHGSTEEINHA